MRSSGIALLLLASVPVLSGQTTIRWQRDDRECCKLQIDSGRYAKITVDKDGAGVRVMLDPKKKEISAFIAVVNESNRPMDLLVTRSNQESLTQRLAAESPSSRDRSAEADSLGLPGRALGSGRHRHRWSRHNINGNRAGPRRYHP